MDSKIKRIFSVEIILHHLIVFEILNLYIFSR